MISLSVFSSKSNPVLELSSLATWPDTCILKLVIALDVPSVLVNSIVPGLTIVSRNVRTSSAALSKTLSKASWELTTLPSNFPSKNSVKLSDELSVKAMFPLIRKVNELAVMIVSGCAYLYLR